MRSMSIPVGSGSFLILIAVIQLSSCTPSDLLLHRPLLSTSSVDGVAGPPNSRPAVPITAGSPLSRLVVPGDLVVVRCSLHCDHVRVPYSASVSYDMPSFLRVSVLICFFILFYFMLAYPMIVAAVYPCC